MNTERIRKLRTGVLMGGDSAEREVSLRSGAAVFKALKERGYRAVAVDTRTELRMIVQKKIDLAFIALHGGHGENGALQGMLEVLGIPYTGSGVLASALAMDKEASKKVFLYSGIPVPKFTILGRDCLKSIASKDGVQLKTGFPLPWVVKPSTEGSSVGVEIVRELSGFKAALKNAFAFSDRVLVERYMPGQEVQIGILNNTVIGGVEVRPSDTFYSYRAKYTAGMTQYIFPPELKAPVYRKVKAAALDAHCALGCSGATRVDLIVDRQGSPYVLEVNTIPGMTETSLLPKIAAQAGYDFGSLVEAILGDAVREK